MTKEASRPLPSSASSTSSRTSVDEGGSEGGGPVGLSTKQLVYIAADIQKLQEKVSTPALALAAPPAGTLPPLIARCVWKVSELLEVVRRRLDAIGFAKLAVVEGSRRARCVLNGCRRAVRKPLLRRNVRRLLRSARGSERLPRPSEQQRPRPQQQDEPAPDRALLPLPEERR